MQVEKTVMCFGDSLTWGWVPTPDTVPTARYSFAERWTGVMAAELGSGYHIIEEGLSARSTSADDPNDPRLNGSQYLPAALASHLPLDLVIIMLGTNDTRVFFNRTPFDIAFGMQKLVGQVLTCGGGVGAIYPAPKCLVVAPPPLAAIPDPYFDRQYEGGQAKTSQLGQQYKDLAAFMKVDFLDAGQVISTDGCDGIHFTAQNNRDLGTAIAGKVRAILEQNR